MNQSPLTQFGKNSQERVSRALTVLQAGGGVLLVDDEDRENEVDLIYSTDHLTVPQMAFMIRQCSGIVCLCLTDDDIDRLQLPPMVDNNTSQNQTAFTISIEAKQGVTTGVSASDRWTTIKTAVNPQGVPEDLSHPGHVFPLKADVKGVLGRRGHTEGTIDLMKLAGLNPSGILCEVTREDGTMARLADMPDFANLYELPVLSIEDIVKYRTYGAVEQ
ncbi:3,4-dihydroxy-2-butanone-4-phosphate synthase [Desulfogranum japonicum]|uniref:3,4-dihydroxy-2-butanone-4-phosphate synthase n=1 Tax=Desulfogranum japonicum TaxID=231447 RepID=UPI000409FECE|nr:3,4-dihydroxy-2-butanone-4-phosphate synthase [Desulfogranum japonicum]